MTFQGYWLLLGRKDGRKVKILGNFNIANGLLAWLLPARIRSFADECNFWLDVCRNVGSSTHCYLPSLDLNSKKERREMKIIQATAQNKCNFSSDENLRLPLQQNDLFALWECAEVHTVKCAS